LTLTATTAVGRSGVAVAVGNSVAVAGVVAVGRGVEVGRGVMVAVGVDVGRSVAVSTGVAVSACAMIRGSAGPVMEPNRAATIKRLPTIPAMSMSKANRKTPRMNVILLSFLAPEA
jgi:UDP-3-O-[3-hydroxymyristoyl] glucosamine N-acyltransferase